mmetsp:Transcript_57931/g.167961  ORF Transcript_57931/g.167961 Transcript_57931/m.167961 type:complete len:257 (+) Transcript_57931:56-826(+)
MPPVPRTLQREEEGCTSCGASGRRTAASQTPVVQGRRSVGKLPTGRIQTRAKPRAWSASRRTPRRAPASKTKRAAEARSPTATTSSMAMTPATSPTPAKAARAPRARAGRPRARPPRSRRSHQRVHNSTAQAGAGRACFRTRSSVARMGPPATSATSATTGGERRGPAKPSANASRPSRIARPAKQASWGPTQRGAPQRGWRQWPTSKRRPPKAPHRKKTAPRRKTSSASSFWCGDRLLSRGRAAVRPGETQASLP